MVGRSRGQNAGACPFQAHAQPCQNSYTTMLSYRQLELRDLPSLLALQEVVRRSLPDPQMFQCEDEPYYARVIAGSGAGFGAFEGPVLAGYGIVTFPGVHSDNLC